MYYFASDIHLGGGDKEIARATERRFVEWLNRVSVDAEAIFLCGDIFDFWFEYSQVVPKGFVRTLGTIASLTDRGIRVVFMAGNHDMWLREYLAEECGMEVYTKPKKFLLAGKWVHVAHGDNLNVAPKEWKLRVLNGLFRSKCAYSTFSRLIHPDLMLKFGLAWSDSSRKKHVDMNGYNTVDGQGVRPLIEYAKESAAGCDYYIYGHLHQHLIYEENGVKYLFINDWNHEPYYAKIDNEGQISLEKA